MKFRKLTLSNVAFTLAALVSICPGYAQDKTKNTDKAEEKLVDEQNPKQGESDGKKDASRDKKGWRSLMPKKGLDGWQATDFFDPGKVERKGDTLVLGIGSPMTGITYKGKDIPTGRYEIEVQANRLEGSDFLCGLTFPVKDGFCSFIAGGWGGSIVGLSSVDGSDASENATTTTGEFKNNTWYTFRIVVDDEYVRGYIDDEEYFRQELDGHEFSTRIELDSSHPLGFAVYDSKVAIKNFRLRMLPKEKKTEKAKAQAQSKEQKGSK